VTLPGFIREAPGTGTASSGFRLRAAKIGHIGLGYFFNFDAWIHVMINMPAFDNGESSDCWMLCG
jgi:hypothetical protein